MIQLNFLNAVIEDNGNGLRVKVSLQSYMIWLSLME